MMTVSAVTNMTDYATTSSSSTSSVTDGLDKNAFMKILITQMQNQDPTQPMDDTQYVSELAQFSSLEQMTNVSDGITALSGMQSTTQALALVGKTVSLTVPGVTDPVTGKVDSIKFESGVPKLVIGGKEYDLSDVTTVQ
jgi:flagellar basal-body rod modification protein FlgD